MPDTDHDEPPAPSGDAVQVWRVPIEAARPEWAVDLDDDERQRLATLRREEDRRRFLLGVTVVRRALGRHLRLPPSAVPLDRRCPRCSRPHGKVRVVGEPGVELSVSHSDRWVLVAVNAGRPIGVDIESVNRGLDVVRLGRLVLSADELAHLQGMAEPQRPAAFTTYWCRKEAIVKATGEGLGASLEHITVSTPDEPAAVRAWAGRPAAPTAFHLYDLHIDPEYRACLAVDGGHRVEVVQLDAQRMLLD